MWDLKIYLLNYLYSSAQSSTASFILTNAFCSPCLKSSRLAYIRFCKWGLIWGPLKQGSVEPSDWDRIYCRAKSIPQFETIPRLHLFCFHEWNYPKHVLLQKYSEWFFYRYQASHCINSEMVGQIFCKLQREFRNLNQGFYFFSVLFHASILVKLNKRGFFEVFTR